MKQSKVRHVYFRLEAGEAVGIGHLMRCMTLNNELIKNHFECRFIFSSQSLASKNMLEDFGLNYIFIKSTNNEKIDSEFCLECIGPVDEEDYFVVDHYSLGIVWELAIKKTGASVIAIDDLANRDHSVDYLIDSNLSRRKYDYSELCDVNTTLLLGGKFSILRSSYFDLRCEARGKRKSITSIENIYIGFGGTDPNNLAVRCLNELLLYKQIKSINITTSRLNANLELLLEFSRNPKVTVWVEHKEIYSLLLESDLAIGSLGISALERVCLGLPSLCLVMADNQLQNAKSLKDLGLVELTDELSLEVDLRKLLDQHDMKKFKEMSRKCFEVIDGLGVDRILHQAFRIYNTVNLIPAELNDCRTLYGFQMEVGARAFSRNVDVPIFEDHEAWFENSLNDQNRKIWMIYYKKTAVGYIRLDEINHTNEISILISNKYKYLGLATSAINELKVISKIKKIIAYVLPENIASIKLFDRCGFKSIGNNYYEWNA